MLWQAGGRLMAMHSLCGVIVSTAIYQACCVSVFIKYHLTSVPSISCEVEQVLSKHYSSKPQQHGQCRCFYFISFTYVC